MELISAMGTGGTLAGRSGEVLGRSSNRSSASASDPRAPVTPCWGRSLDSAPCPVPPARDGFPSPAEGFRAVEGAEEPGEVA